MFLAGIRSTTEISVQDNLFQHIQPNALANLAFDSHNDHNHSQQHTFNFTNNRSNNDNNV